MNAVVWERYPQQAVTKSSHKEHCALSVLMVNVAWDVVWACCRTLNFIAVLLAYTHLHEMDWRD
eukprot:259260-Amphidinium_carterae.1